ncbi:hypothetical protein [Phaeodactylibacter sp.]|uniref:hypothetical protein n=1 Tax=Phaeodactylibacter sp. TaxID=1940289 RepID=UPI0025D6406A|nr:hypothetical protein [Phaeodactylibacter sp.]MCI4650891.1 hypothetical protein [Phaeodactylibacter sp.]MCI5089848.1 hypothetical protein [Phaeodactylibacter sp.]
MEFISTLKAKNELLFIFGLVNFIFASLFVLLSQATSIEVLGTNAWYKPLKFALSIGIFSWTIAWFMSYLPQDKSIQIMSWLIVLMLGFEILYIGIQAGRGQLSHYNLSTPIYGGLYVLMAFAATVVSFITLVLAIRFFQVPLPELPDYYIWSIRAGLILFFIFSLEGFVMGANLSHTIGASSSGKVIPFLNWSREYGDPRVAHFVGMHALQVLPIASCYILKDIRLTFGLVILYTLMAVYVLIQALYGHPFLKS